MDNTLTECAAVDETVVFLNYFKDLRARELGVAGRHPPFQHLFREWGTIVGLVRLVPDNGQLPVEARVAQGFGAAEPREGGTNNDDPAAGPEGGDDVGHECRGAHDAVPFPLSCMPLACMSSMIACTGQDAAARRTRWRCESSGFGSYMTASSPCSLMTSGASGTH
jgi:hypothetical protein